MSENLSLEDLENLISNAEGTDSLDETDARPTKTYTDFAKMKKKSQKSAKKLLRKLVNFYLTEEMIKNEWTIQKIKSDYENLTNVIFQLKVSDYLIIKALEEIDFGVVHDRILRALKDLQNQNMEVMKYHKQYLQIIDQEYETFAENYSSIISKLQNTSIDQIGNNSNKSLTNNIHRGSKSIIEDIEEINFEDIDSEEDK